MTTAQSYRQGAMASMFFSLVSTAITVIWIWTLRQTPGVDHVASFPRELAEIYAVVEIALWVLCLRALPGRSRATSNFVYILCAGVLAIAVFTHRLGLSPEMERVAFVFDAVWLAPIAVAAIFLRRLPRATY
jgi:hypothetical protein